ncbi:MAG: transcription-repair coupling factor [Alphaproteobacteria bacterium]|nr:transcription-repair coupling factor [Alphaproteobacteria bacterium]
MLAAPFGRVGRAVITGVPEGLDARLLAEVAVFAAPTPILYIACDDARLSRVAEALRFFAPSLEQIVVPAWDCLPYDRASPRPDIVSQRMAALVQLAAPAPSANAHIVLTTINAVLQRVPPRAMLANASLTVAVGATISRERLAGFLEANGYVATGTVMEAGEYALRGGIVDIFPSGADEPVRLDLFGDTVEAIRRFDAMTQRSAATLNAITLSPVSEVLLTPEAIARFRAGYRVLFGAVSGDDQLFEAISAGRHQAGMEHWLPLFHERLDTLFDYVPGAPVALDHQADDARDRRLEAISDFYDARASAPATSMEADYKPIPPAKMFLDKVDWEKALSGRAVGQFSSFRVADADGINAIEAWGRRARDFSAERVGGQTALFDVVRGHIDTERGEGRRVVVACVSAGSRERLRRLLAEHGLDRLTPVDNCPECNARPAGEIGLAVLPIEHGFVAGDLSLLAEQDILGERLSRAAPKRKVRAEHFLADATELKEGDLVVHSDHGIGRYMGLETIAVDGAPHDCLKLYYRDDDRLFLPVENIELLSRYGSADQPVELDKLGGAHWQARKARLKKRILEMANELIKIAAERLVRPSDRFDPAEADYDAFAARFPYSETEDQARAIEDSLADLASGRPMDRLICGDVGFGKTEVALRAAYVVAASGRQVAVLAPTTLLARQHFATFKSRFEGLPFRIAQLSRLVPAKDAAIVKRELAAGTVDIVIGTHALLAQGIQFDRLALIVVDEEQHFGVTHKERLKQLKANLHVLTLTATPIPRTLQLALSGVRDMSVISTPPVDRLAVRTFILPFDPVVLREGIMREHFRGGQSFYVCPRVADLDDVAARLRALVPEVKIGLAHGQMGAVALEKVMSAFYDGAFDVLVSTAIVESGLDLPRANTLIVHRADMFGLAQLYQLRGRIGRAKVRAYAYFTLQPNHRLTEAALKRLDVIHRLDTLGAGFALASHDLDIRGAGNLLGAEQSGHIREVGIELYQQMLEEAVRSARGGAAAEMAETAWSPHIALGAAVLIPETYVTDLDVRLNLYRRLSHLEDRSEIDACLDELTDRFGPPPDEVLHLLKIIAIKRICRRAGISRVDAGPKGAVLSFRNDRFAAPEKLIAYVSKPEHGLRLRPDSKLVAPRDWSRLNERVGGIEKLLEQIAGLAA